MRERYRGAASRCQSSDLIECPCTGLLAAPRAGGYAGAYGRDPDATHVERLKQVGRYALGVEWGDGHDSIMPAPHASAASVRATRAPAPIPARRCRRAAEQPRPASRCWARRRVFVAWADGTRRVLLTEELRALCRCAHCVGEPDYPISGR